MRIVAYLAAALLAASCGKKSDTPPAPDPTVKEPGSGGSAAAKPATPPATVPVTSKSPEAIKMFEQGRDLTDSERGPEAVEHFQKAIELDPDFAQAHAYLGIVTQGPPGIAELEKAKTLAVKLPEAERLVIDGALAGRNGDHAGMLAAYTKLTAVAPGDWRTLIALGWDATEGGDPAKGIQMFEKALAIKPDLAVVQDGLAYAHAGKGEWEPAIAAAKKQVELLPKQPNPQDTLGEILLMAGKYEDAEKAFQAAIDVEAKYNTAWQGIALSRAYRNDFKGALEANEKENAGAPDAYASVKVIEDGAWIALAANNLPDAIARMDVIEKDADAKKTPAFAFAALQRAAILIEAEKYADAAKWLATAKTRGDKLPAFSQRQFARDYAIGALRVAALTKKAAPDADKLVAALDEDAKAGDPITASFAAWGHGMAAWAKSGPKDAVADLSKCRTQLVACRYDLADAQRKGGDTAAADATEKQIAAAPLREASAVYYVTDTLAPAVPAVPPKK